MRGKRSEIGFRQLQWALFAAAVLWANCGNPPPKSTFKAPQWSRNLAIYEVNLRQYSEAGTFAAFAESLPELRDLGVGILWFMPIHPIGKERRKGTLGSYYSVQDYYAVNSEFGSLQEFKTLVTRIHEMGMYVIIDWVANHTAWDNSMLREHPEWYTRDESNEITSPVPDWHDVADLNYEQPELRRYMIEAMKFWVRETDIDGFRCDVAEMVPIDFWPQVREELETLKRVFMLAEGSTPELHRNGFDMTYSWDLFKVMNAVASGHKTVAAVDSVLEEERQQYGAGAYRMRFTTNHDENSWNGTVFERLGEGAEVFTVLAATVPGMPLLYSGQEAGLDKRLNFFEKDMIEWRDHRFRTVFAALLRLKKENPALWNGEHGGEMSSIANSAGDRVFSFLRTKGDNQVFAALNLSSVPQSCAFTAARAAGEWTDMISGAPVTIGRESELEMGPWEYRLLVK